MKKIVYIVTNHATMDVLPKFSDSIKVFSDKAKAARQYIDWLGDKDILSLSFGISDQVGVKTFSKSGDVSVEFFVAEVEE